MLISSSLWKTRLAPQLGNPKECIFLSVEKSLGYLLRNLSDTNNYSFESAVLREQICGHDVSGPSNFKQFKYMENNI